MKASEVVTEDMKQHNQMAWVGAMNSIHKKLLELICRNEEKLQATMTDEQKELFSKYTDCVREYQTIQIACCSKTALGWEQG